METANKLKKSSEKRDDLMAMATPIIGVKGSIQILTQDEIVPKIRSLKNPYHSQYLAMYSSWLGAIVTEPTMMVIPIDDHLVHRGDGVFEAIKVSKGRFLLVREHLARLERSAVQLGLKLPVSPDETLQIIRETYSAAKTQNTDDAMIRIFLSRGPGTFSVNPYDSIGNQLYVVVTTFKSPPTKWYESGVRIGRSQIPVKQSWMAQVKTCNYIPNVMMKKEAVDQNLDFVVGFDSDGYLGESATENIILLDANGFLVRPFLHNILKGTTMIRALELAEKLKAQGLIKGVREANISEEMLLEAQEVMMIGTTIDVVPVIEYAGKPISTGKVGKISQVLLQELREDFEENF